MTDVTPKLGGWLADSGQPDAVGQVDLLFVDHHGTVRQTSTTTVVERNGVLDLRQWCSPVENQRELGSCVGNSVVGALEFLQGRDGLPRRDLSRLFVYYNSRLMHRAQDVDGGTFIRLAIGTLSSLGTCTEEKWPYDVSKVFVRPAWGSYREAYTNKVGAYYRIDGTGEDRVRQVKSALQTCNPVVFGVSIDQAFLDLRTGDVPMLNSKFIVGAHAMMLCGYDDNSRRFIVRNSWGTGWGDGGYCLMPYEYMDAGGADDFWVVTAAV